MKERMGVKMKERCWGEHKREKMRILKGEGEGDDE